MTTDKPIRPVTPDDLPVLKKIIDGTELFPSDLLDDMAAGYFANDEEGGYWLTYDDGEPVAVAYYVPEQMTEGTWNVITRR